MYTLPLYINFLYTRIYQIYEQLKSKKLNISIFLKIFIFVAYIAI